VGAEHMVSASLNVEEDEESSDLMSNEGRRGEVDFITPTLRVILQSSPIATMIILGDNISSGTSNLENSTQHEFINTPSRVLSSS
jgi:hypothetical protein